MFGLAIVALNAPSWLGTTVTVIGTEGCTRPVFTFWAFGAFSNWNGALPRNTKLYTPGWTFGLICRTPPPSDLSAAIVSGWLLLKTKPGTNGWLPGGTVSACT